EVRAHLARELGLAEPDITWHVARDGLAEAVQLLALVTGSLAKIATDIMLLMTTEVAEVAEPFVSHRGGSSTMPQKRNPISCELMVAAHRIVRQSAGLMLDAMAADLERATGPWHLEWAAVPEAFIATSGALEQAKFVLAGLEVDETRMRKNLDMTGGLIVAEAVMMGLAPFLGRNEAHDIVYAACRAALQNATTLREELLKQKAVTDKLSEAEIARLVEPSGYLGSAGAMVDRVLAREARNRAS
ncbi:MAG: 3-carboxy-cis,cis-muconate cycloisomerase, partial [Hyphomicrobiaceae bacterium]